MAYARTRIQYLIIGNGITGVTAAESLRAQDSQAAITIVADDPFPVYYRPALKDYLAGRMPEEKLWARPSSFYQENHIGFIAGRVRAINAQQHAIQLHNGQQLDFQKLLLAQGARPRQLVCPGTQLAGVSTLRTVADYQQILRHLDTVKRVIICGSGTLALESAEVLQKYGCQVTHLLRGSTLWSEVLDAAASDLVLQEERRAGIDVRTDEEIAGIMGNNGQVSSITTTHHETIPCELVLIAIGIQPNIDFLRGSGISCHFGVQVDQYMHTNVPNVYAAGDVIETVDERSGKVRLLGQWYPAIQQARIAAHHMLHTTTSSPAHAFSLSQYNYYNASFLYGLDFASIGLSAPPQSLPPSFQSVIAPPQPRNYRKALCDNGVLVGALFLGDRQQAMSFKRAIDHHVNIKAVAQRLFTPDFDFAAWLDEQHVPDAILDFQPGLSTLSQQSRTVNLDMHAEASAEQTQEHSTATLVPVSHDQIQLSLPEFTLHPDQKTTIGRNADASYVLEHRSVSRYHAEIDHNGASYTLIDKGSSNGTFINNKRLAPGKASPLHNNDLIRFGDIQLRFTPNQDLFQHLQGTELGANATRTIPDHILSSLPPTPTLVLVGQQTKPAIIPLSPKKMSIGRDHGNSLALDDPATSQTHAELFPTKDGFYIRDLDSRNGVFVNKIKINNPYHLLHGDDIVIGNMLLHYSFPQSLAQHTEQITPYRLPAIRTATPPPPPPVPGLRHRPAIQPLAQKGIDFEIDMCIGCDRCMVACPIPSSADVTIADLNRATIKQAISPQVALFTQECIMCGSCVPVCPVDNHRDLLMLALKQRVGSSWEDAADIEHITEKLPANWSLARLLRNLRAQPALSDADTIADKYLLHLASASHLLQLQAGETVIREGEYGRDLYFVLEGRIALFASSGNNAEFPVAMLGAGEHVGEDGMLTGRPYNASAKVQTPSVILRVPEQVMQHLEELVPSVRSFFNQINNIRSLHSILKRMALFRDIPNDDINALIQQAQVEQYDRDSYLFTETDRQHKQHKQRPERETLHILLEGFVKVTRTPTRGVPTRDSDGAVERVIAYRQAGDYFAGGLDLLGDGKAVTVTTINRVRVAEIPRQALLALFERYPEVDHRFSQRLREYARTATLTQSSMPAMNTTKKLARTTRDLPVQTGLHSLVSQGVVEGNEVLVIDLDKCIHCNECEEACERRHGHSRMNRKGKVIGNISITTTCRQCQDPVCMLCSRAGIARKPNGEVYITESCIGCGICAERCPYNAISIVDIEGEKDVPFSHDTSKEEKVSWMRFKNFFAQNNTAQKGKQKNLPMLQAQVARGPLALANVGHEPYEELRKKIAIKCDLCAGYKDQACVQACPTGAAIRIQPTDFFGSTEEILHR